MTDRSFEAGSVDRSVIVTGDHNTATLVFGDSGVRLPIARRQIPRADPRPARPPGPDARELDVLAPTADLPLFGREAELAGLRAWLDDEAAVSVHAVIGEAGTGKTRLALELCRAIDPDLKPGAWVAGFVDPDMLAPVVAALATRQVAWASRTLLVVDYAIACREALAGLLDRLTQDEVPGRVRILILEREASPEQGWWRDLSQPALDGKKDRSNLFHGAAPQRLAGLAAREERRGLVKAAQAAARALRPDLPEPAAVPEPGADAAFDARLDEARFANPLSLVMAGVLSVDRPPGEALALRRLDAARKLARRELARLEGQAKTVGVSAQALRHAIAFNGLAGGLPTAGLRKTLKDEFDAAVIATDVAALATLLRAELPAADDEERPGAAEEAGEPRLGTIRPDLVGEGAILEALEGEDDADAAALVARAYAATGGAAAAALMRLAQDFAYALEDATAKPDEVEVARRVMGWIAALAEGIDDPEMLEPLAYALPRQTTILREAAAAITARVVEGFREAAGDDLNERGRAAGWINNLSVRLSDLGRREDALAAAEEAAASYRGLAAERPGAFMPVLAGVLKNIATFRSDLGRREDALAAAKEATVLYRGLDSAQPGRFTSDVAGALSNLASRLSDLGDFENAFTVAEEAASLYRTLAAARPGAFELDYAIALTNLALRLIDNGRCEDALAAAEEAVLLQRTLAAAQPDAFTPNLATALINLAKCLNALGRFENALTAAQEALTLYRMLATGRPDVFKPNVAMALNNLANSLNTLGRFEVALAAAEESVSIRRILVADQPASFVINLSVSLGSLSDSRFLLGDISGAHAALDEAIRTLLPVFLRSPPSVARWMQMHLQRYPSRCAAAGVQPDEVLLAPILETFQRLEQENPDGE
ncbi:tetratricopeptide repeat protein [Salinarimonas sp. NSM]|uniref:tetratricopeptide repeat protein n=1 Tax=Salinarimonas sp. NSM TaxID=3458003 RepID=UPI004035D2C3